MTDRHGFHDHYGKDRAKDAEDKFDVDDPDMSKRPICTECGRKTYPWDFASKAWHKAHPKKNYCQASRSVDGTGDSSHMDWHIGCDGKDISIGIGVVKDTEDKVCASKSHNCGGVVQQCCVRCERHCLCDLKHKKDRLDETLSLLAIWADDGCSEVCTNVIG